MLFFGFLSGAGLNQVTSTFWPTPQPFAKVQQPIIPHLKEGIQGFDINTKTAIVISQSTLTFLVPYESPESPLSNEVW